MHLRCRPTVNAPEAQTLRTLRLFPPAIHLRDDHRAAYAVLGHQPGPALPHGVGSKVRPVTINRDARPLGLGCKFQRDARVGLAARKTCRCRCGYPGGYDKSRRQTAGNHVTRNSSHPALVFGTLQRLPIRGHAVNSLVNAATSRKTLPWQANLHIGAKLRRPLWPT